VGNRKIGFESCVILGILHRPSVRTLASSPKDLAARNKESLGVKENGEVTAVIVLHKEVTIIIGISNDDDVYADTTNQEEEAIISVLYFTVSM
jgi:hypothetical protein